MMYTIQDDPRARVFNTEDDALRGLIELIHAFWLTSTKGVEITNSKNQSYYGEISKFSLQDVIVKFPQRTSDKILILKVIPYEKPLNLL